MTLPAPSKPEVTRSGFQEDNPHDLFEEGKIKEVTEKAQKWVENELKKGKIKSCQ